MKEGYLMKLVISDSLTKEEFDEVYTTLVDLIWRYRGGVKITTPTKMIYFVYKQAYDDFPIEKAFESLEQAQAYIEEMEQKDLYPHYFETELTEGQ